MPNLHLALEALLTLKPAETQRKKPKTPYSVAAAWVFKYYPQHFFLANGSDFTFEGAPRKYKKGHVPKNEPRDLKFPKAQILNDAPNLFSKQLQNKTGL